MGAWYNENVALTGAASGLAAGWAAKAPVHLARIALVLHLLAHAGEPLKSLSAETMRDAILIVEYFRDHLRRVRPAFGAASLSAGAGLGSRIRRVLARAVPGWVGRAELAIRLGGHDAREAIAAVLASLEERGEAERRTAETSGRPREEWRWLADHAEEPDDDPFSRHHVIMQQEESTNQTAEANGKHDVRDYVESRDKPRDETFSRNHVITHDASNAIEAAPGDPWETWEEVL